MCTWSVSMCSRSLMPLISTSSLAACCFIVMPSWMAWWVSSFASRMSLRSLSVHKHSSYTTVSWLQSLTTDAANLYVTAYTTNYPMYPNTPCTMCHHPTNKLPILHAQCAITPWTNYQYSMHNVPSPHEQTTNTPCTMCHHPINKLPILHAQCAWSIGSLFMGWWHIVHGVLVVCSCGDGHIVHGVLVVCSWGDGTMCMEYW